MLEGERSSSRKQVLVRSEALVVGGDGSQMISEGANAANATISREIFGGSGRLCASWGVWNVFFWEAACRATFAGSS